MSIVAVLGAGSIGGATAYKLAERNRFREVRLIDESAGVAEGKALDIQQAGAIEQFATRLTCSTDVRDAIGARILVTSGTQLRVLREIQAGSGYLSMRPKQQHFGLGRFASVDVRITWPGGQEQLLEGVAAGGSYVIEQGSGIVSEPDRTTAKVTRGPTRDPAERRIETCRLLSSGAALLSGRRSLRPW